MSLKLKINTSSLNRTLSLNTPGATPIAGTPVATPGAATPGGSKPKTKIKFKTASQPGTPAPGPGTPSAIESSRPKKTKAGRATKPTAKIVEARKRMKEDELDDDESHAIKQAEPPYKKLKLTIGSKNKTFAVPGSAVTVGTPRSAGGPLTIKTKLKGKIPERKLASGYDSESSDKDVDPVTENQFILRMAPGEDCDYLRQAIIDKKIGPRSQGGADVVMKFFHVDGIRACIIIRGNIYAATLVDLPCIIEGMKSWDKRGWWKSADICQMLLVFAQVKSEEEARTIPLPAEIGKQHLYPHGITPPMYHARTRRFRKRVHTKDIESVEKQVNALLERDGNSKVSYRIYDPDAEARQQSLMSAGRSSDGEEYSDDEDAEGEDDDEGYFDRNNGVPDGQVPVEDMEEEGVFDLEAALEESFAPDNGNGQTEEASTPMTMASAQLMEEEDDSGDESVEDDDVEDGATTNKVDAEAEAEAQKLAGVRQDIAELEETLVKLQASIAGSQNVIIKKRMSDSVVKLKQEIELKKSSLAEEEDAEE